MWKQLEIYLFFKHISRFGGVLKNGNVVQTLHYSNKWGLHDLLKIRLGTTDLVLIKPLFVVSETETAVSANLLFGSVCVCYTLHHT